METVSTHLTCQNHWSLRKFAAKPGIYVPLDTHVCLSYTHLAQRHYNNIQDSRLTMYHQSLLVLPSGSMAMTQRTKAIEAFQRDPPTTVFILTMRTAACGINLTAASHIYLLEPCMNPALESQAIGRAWRMGQRRPVYVKRLYVKVGT